MRETPAVLGILIILAGLTRLHLPAVLPQSSEALVSLCESKLYRWAAWTEARGPDIQ